ncbi:hypothetical protein ACNQVK_01185 [Mycobacterium sp. 134]|uniref:hypothetical protein n=1 Tax=Mycobacterium sp. 134 TaxID=3400425 RepID=UPI003AAE1A00
MGLANAMVIGGAIGPRPKDIETVLEIVALPPEYRASPWRIHDPTAVKPGERKDAALAAGKDDAGPPRSVPARVRALLRQHVAAGPR